MGWRTSPISWVGLSSKHTTGRFGSAGAASRAGTTSLPGAGGASTPAGPPLFPPPPPVTFLPRPRRPRPARPRLLAQRSLQVAQHEAALGPVHRRAADAHRPGDLLVAGSGIGRQQDLRSLQFARRMLAAAQQRLKLGAFRFAQLDPVPYIHSNLLEPEPTRIQR